MSTMTNPVWNAMLPGAPNPTGTSVSVPTGKSTTSGGNPLLYNPYGTSTSAPTAMNPISAGFPAAPVPGGPAPTFGANTGGGYQSGSLLGPPGTNPISGTGNITGRQQGRSIGELQSQYGEGLGALMYQFLQGGAGFNQQAINNLFAALQPGIERGEEDLMSQFSASGNRFSSGAQIGLADYLSQVQLNEGQLETQMYEQSLTDYMNTLMGVSSASLQQKLASPGFFDYFSTILGAGAKVGAAALAGG